MKNYTLVLFLAALLPMTDVFGQPYSGTTTFTGNIGAIASSTTGTASGTLQGYTFTLLSKKTSAISNTGNAVELTSSPSGTGKWYQGTVASSDNSSFQLLKFTFEVTDPSFAGLYFNVTGAVGTTAVPGASTTTPTLVVNTLYTVDVSSNANFANINNFYFFPSTLTTANGGFNIVSITIVSNHTLPVVWTAPLTAVVNAGKPLVSWSVSSQIDNQQFDVQRSTDGVNFLDQATVLPTEAHTYNYIDATATQGTYFYRIKQVDQDGKYTYSTIASLTLKATGISIFPNPTVDMVTVNNVSAGDVLQLTNLSGQVIATRQGGGTIAINMQMLPPAIYLLRSKNQGTVFKILKQ